MSESQKLKAVNKDKKIIRRKERNMKDRNSKLRKERNKDRNSKLRKGREYEGQEFKTKERKGI